MPPFSKQIKPKHKLEPLWKGPCDDGPLGGISQSMIGRFLVCPERFRIQYILGLQPPDDFNHRLEYGQMWHVCEEALAKDGSLVFGKTNMPTGFVCAPLKEYAIGLCRKYPLRQEEINHWYNVCRVQFPIYADYWAKHPDVQERTPLLQEQVFHVPYKLPSGRTVWLKGKFDSVDLIGKGKQAGIYLQENKTKGDIDEQHLQQQLTFDLQTMMYLVALQEYSHQPDNELVAGQQIRGIRYNVIRRPLAGGRGSISKYKNTNTGKGSKSLPPKPETDEEFYARLGEVIANEKLDDGSSYFFMRWKVEVIPTDIERFKQQFLNPTLERLCSWYDWVAYCVKIDRDPFTYETPDEFGLHFRYPWGIWNPLNEGRPTDVDSYLDTGSTVGLVRAETLFKELQ